MLSVAASLAVLAFSDISPSSPVPWWASWACPVQGWDLILPLGIGYTFELISYLVDLRRGDRPHYKLRKFCLFIFLFRI